MASQLEALKQRIQQDGITLGEELCFVDEGYSGSTLLRPSLERLRDLAAAGGLDRLYVHSPDRLARKYAYQVLLIDELRRCGVEVCFLNRRIGLSPEDDLLLQVQGMVAEYERRWQDDGPQRSSSDPQLAGMIERVQRGIARLIDAYEDGLLERPEFEPRIKRAKSRLEKLQGQAQALAEDRAQEQQLRLVIGQLREFAGRVTDGVRQTDWVTRRELIRTLVKRVEIKKEDVRIVYRLSPSSQSKDPDGAILQHCRRSDLTPMAENSISG
jgi:DNA invertase Pin-like site-specific DNA recombinase